MVGREFHHWHRIRDHGGRAFTTLWRRPAGAFFAASPTICCASSNDVQFDPYLLHHDALIYFETWPDRIALIEGYEVVPGIDEKAAHQAVDHEDVAAVARNRPDTQMPSMR
jgi:hypothetical protein